MSNKIQSLDSKFYQPNIFVAILLGLYATRENSITIIKNNEPKLKVFIEDLKVAFLVNGKSLVNFIEDDSSVKISIKTDDFVLKNKHSYLSNLNIDDEFENISCKEFFKDYVKRYAKSFYEDNLEDEHENKLSWETCATSFIDSIDKKYNLNDYKIFDIKSIHVILVYCDKKLINGVKIELTPKKVSKKSLYDDSAWDVKLTVGLKTLIRSIKGETEPVKFKYTDRELRVLEEIQQYLHDEVPAINPEELIDLIDLQGYRDYAKSKKYLSNFISRLNKKFYKNTGHKRFKEKVFNDNYLINVLPDEL